MMEIPEDIRDVAQAVLDEINLPDASALLPAIARAIVEERERCAKIAEDFGSPYYLKTETGAMMYRAVTDKIAAAIRRPTGE